MARPKSLGKALQALVQREVRVALTALLTVVPPKRKRRRRRRA